MFTKRFVIYGILVLLVFTAAGCTTWYYKQFAVNASPPKINNGFVFRTFDCSFGIDAKPNDTGSLEDSSYTVWFCISTTNSINCNNVWDSLVGTIEITGSRLFFDESTVILSPQEDNFGRHSCQKCWDSEDIIIPELVDTLAFELHLTYFDDGRQILADTSVELYRFQGKQRHFISF